MLLLLLHSTTGRELKKIMQKLLGIKYSWLSSLFHRKMMTLRKVISRSTRGLLLPLISPKWMPLSQRSCWRCPRRGGLSWFSPQSQGILMSERRRRSQACGRAASSTPTLTFRGSYSLSSFCLAAFQKGTSNRLGLQSVTVEDRGTSQLINRSIYLTVINYY